MMWNLERGFLPSEDPIERLPSYTSEHIFLEMAAKNLAEWNENGSVREELVHVLRLWGVLGKNPFETPPEETEELQERLMMLYSYFASAYVHSKHDKPAFRLPAEISSPLEVVAGRVHRRPILSYANYCLTNWRRIDPQKPIELGNIELLQNFTLEAKRDEDWFILVHVDIEAKGAKAVQAVKRYLETDDDDLVQCLTDINESLEEMCKTLLRMPEQCSVDVYYDKVRPYIWGFDQVKMESSGRVVTYRGETGAQSSLIPAIQTALGIVHKDSMLTKHLAEMREYMPETHRHFLESAEDAALRIGAPIYGANELYNAAVMKLHEFRKIHLGYALDYIQKKTGNPSGTGGTPYVPWLSKLADETLEYLL